MELAGWEWEEREDTQRGSWSYIEQNCGSRQNYRVTQRWDEEGEYWKS